MANYKKISFDFHGVINTAPEFFAAVLRTLRRHKVRVYVVSGGPREYIEQYLAIHKIPYDALWCIFDYFNAREKVEVAADGSFHIDDALWDAAKGEYCAREKIGLHIDDSEIYGKYFTTPYVRFDSKEQHFEIAFAVLDVDEGAAQVAKILHTICRKESELQVGNKITPSDK